MTYIDNNVCIECHACVSVCPVRAIYDVDDLPQDLQYWIAINADRSAELPLLKLKQPPLAGADERRRELGF